ncbi:hypothetical protein [Methanolapillus millepedarum]|uniref:Uncharacterized protein n=1 Tax=Methanolapillus millepedarum TaxID=3028296 RepID=A0AA96ZUW4_9EURY|nr:hypothetical protein MsAc7_17680 [Methanosarcinaceae archaeon Ac7]
MTIIDDVKMRLKQFGYAADDSDNDEITWCKNKIERKILDFCHIPKVPSGLYYVEVDMICGEFLFEKKSTGDVSKFENIDLKKPITQSITEGNTSVVFTTPTSTPSSRLDSFIQALRNGGPGAMSQLVRHRRLAWKGQ